MRILVINEYVLGGGAEQIASDQVNLLSQNGHDVLQLCFNYSSKDKTNADWSDNRHIIVNSPPYKKFIFDVGLYVSIRKILKTFSPDKIVLHNVSSSPMAVYYAVRHYDSVQIVHDFSILCPKVLGVFLNDNCKICNGFGYNSCIKKCSKGFKDCVLMLFRLIRTKEVFYFRKWFVKKFISPSEWLSDAIRQYGFKSCVLNNPINYVVPSSNKTRDIIPKLITAGGLTFNKGVIAFANRIADREDISLDIYGNSGNKEDFKKIEIISKKSNNRIVYKGYLRHDSLMSKFKEYCFLLVPSLCRENYPTIVLEAMMNKICVIASDRGGAKEIIADGRGLLFSWDNEDSINQVIASVCKMSAEEYNEIVDRAYEYVVDNNSMEKYYEKLIDLI